jgi:hypothetical protein
VSQVARKHKQKNKKQKAKSKNMKRKIIASLCVLAGLSVSLSVRASIAVYNSGFENVTGTTATGWTVENGGGGNTVVDTAGAGLAGSYGEVFTRGGTGQVGIELVPPPYGVILTTATTYQVSFWAKTTGTGTGTLQVSLNGNDSGPAGQGASPVFTSATGYTEYFVNMVPQHLNQQVEMNFDWSGSGILSLDDIGLSAVPEPSTVLAGLLVLVPTGASTLQILRKKRNT